VIKKKSEIGRFEDSLKDSYFLQVMSFFATFSEKSDSTINIPFDFKSKPYKSCITSIMLAAGETGTSFCLQTLYKKFYNNPIYKTVESGFKKLPKPIRTIFACSALSAHLVTVRAISKLVAHSMGVNN